MHIKRSHWWHSRLYMFLPLLAVTPVVEQLEVLETILAVSMCDGSLHALQQGAKPWHFAAQCCLVVQILCRKSTCQQPLCQLYWHRPCSWYKVLFWIWKRVCILYICLKLLVKTSFQKGCLWYCGFLSWG